MQRWSQFAIALLVGWLSAGPAAAQTVVAPNAAETAEGNTNFNLPFSRTESIRCQTAYSASQFSALAGGKRITGVRYRFDQHSGQDFTTNYTNVLIRLSTTSVAPNALSTTFANNVGANVTTVHSGPLTLSGTNAVTGNGTKAFSIGVNFAAPFLYNPAQGNLLLDFKATPGQYIGQFDAVTGSNVGSVFSFSPEATSGLGPDFVAPVAQFVYEDASETPAVPEPGSLLLFLPALALVAGWRKRHSAAADLA